MPTRIVFLLSLVAVVAFTAIESLAAQNAVPIGLSPGDPHRLSFAIHPAHDATSPNPTLGTPAMAIASTSPRNGSIAPPLRGGLGTTSDGFDTIADAALLDLDLEAEG